MAKVQYPLVLHTIATRNKEKTAGIKNMGGCNANKVARSSCRSAFPDDLVSFLNLFFSWDIGSNETGDRGPAPAGLLRKLAHNNCVSLLLLSLHQWMVKNKRTPRKRAPSTIQKKLKGALERRKGKKVQGLGGTSISHSYQDSLHRRLFGPGMTALGEDLMKRNPRHLMSPLSEGPSDTVVSRKEQLQQQLLLSAGGVGEPQDLWALMNVHGHSSSLRRHGHHHHRHHHRRPGSRRSHRHRSQGRHLAFVGFSEGLLSYYVRLFTVWVIPDEMASLDSWLGLIPPSHILHDI